MIFEKNLKKLRFWTKLAKIFEIMSILVNFSKIFDFGPNLQKRIFFLNSKNVDFIKTFENFRFWWKFTNMEIFFSKISKNFDLSEVFEKNWIWVKFSRKIWIWVKFFEKISILFRKFRFLSKLTKNLISFENFEKCRFRSHFEKKFDFG